MISLIFKVWKSNDLTSFEFVEYIVSQYYNFINIYFSILHIFPIIHLNCGELCV